MKNLLTTTLAGLMLCTLQASAFTLDVTIRDFLDSHPDFEPTAENPNPFEVGVRTGQVEDMLGLDGKPVAVAAEAGTSFTSVASFNQWYNDVAGINQTTNLSLNLTPTGDAGNPTYAFTDLDFFTINDQLFGNQGRSQNYHFTLEAQAELLYQGGEVLDFVADDDLWVFINGKLAVDLGGLHGAASKSIDLDAIAGDFSLNTGDTFDFRLFYAERNTVDAVLGFETTEVIPEPSTWAMIIAGLLGIVGLLLRRKQRT